MGILLLSTLIGILATWGCQRNLQESPRHRPGKIPWMIGILFTIGAACIGSVLLEQNTTQLLISTGGAALLTACTSLLIAKPWREWN